MLHRRTFLDVSSRSRLRATTAACGGGVQWDALFAGLGFDGLIALNLESIPHQLQVLGVVFDEQDQLIRHGAPGV